MDDQNEAMQIASSQNQSVCGLNSFFWMKRQSEKERSSTSILKQDERMHGDDWTFPCKENVEVHNVK